MNFNIAITVGQLMTKDLFILSPTDSLLKVEEVFKANRFHHIPIVDEANHIIGIISRVDFNKMQDSFTLFNTVNTTEINNSLFKSVLIKDIMVQQVATLHPADTALTAMDMFKENLL